MPASNLDKDIKDHGFVIGGEIGKKGNSYYYANIEPSAGRWYRQFLPWVGRWWFEVSEVEKVPSDELGIGVVTHAYTNYGSGGAYTLRGCVIKAMDAIERATERDRDAS